MYSLVRACEAVSGVMLSWGAVQLGEHVLGAADHAVEAWEAAMGA